MKLSMTIRPPEGYYILGETDRLKSGDMYLNNIPKNTWQLVNSALFGYSVARLLCIYCRKIPTSIVVKVEVVKRVIDDVEVHIPPGFYLISDPSDPKDITPLPGDKWLMRFDRDGKVNHEWRDVLPRVGYFKGTMIIRPIPRVEN